MCNFLFDSRYRPGIVLGVISAAVCSLYSISNRKASEGVKARTMPPIRAGFEVKPRQIPDKFSYICQV